MVCWVLKILYQRTLVQTEKATEVLWANIIQRNQYTLVCIVPPRRWGLIAFARVGFEIGIAPTRPGRPFHREPESCHFWALFVGDRPKVEQSIAQHQARIDPPSGPHCICFLTRRIGAGGDGFAHSREARRLHSLVWLQDTLDVGIASEEGCLVVRCNRASTLAIASIGQRAK